MNPPADSESTPPADSQDTCDSVLFIPARAAVEAPCIREKGHTGFCHSRDGRAWERKEP
jgi:hypothetical protein